MKINYSSITCEKNESLEIFQTDTVINIRTMMIHPHNTFASTAMRCSGRFVSVILFWALINLSVKRVIVS